MDDITRLTCYTILICGFASPLQWPQKPWFIRLRPHVSGDFCIRKFFYVDTKLSASKRSVYESYTPVHTYPIRIRTSQRISEQVLILWRQRIQKYTDTNIHTYPDTQLIQKFPLWRAYTEISGYNERIQRTRVDTRCICIKKFEDTKISGYWWTGPKLLSLNCFTLFALNGLYWFHKKLSIISSIDVKTLLRT